jgi:hypothetical protein
VPRVSHVAPFELPVPAMARAAYAAGRLRQPRPGPPVRSGLLGHRICRSVRVQSVWVGRLAGPRVGQQRRQAGWAPRSVMIVKRAVRARRRDRPVLDGSGMRRVPESAYRVGNLSLRIAAILAQGPLPERDLIGPRSATLRAVDPDLPAQESSHRCRCRPCGARALNRRAGSRALAGGGIGDRYSRCAVGFASG